MPGGEDLIWEDIEDVARRLWPGEPERRWARQAWEMIVDQGLAEWLDEMSWQKAQMRFVTLAALYRDFWRVKAGDCSSSWCTVDDWGTQVNDFCIGYLAGKAGVEVDYVMDDYSHLQKAARGTLHLFRDEVVDALIDGYGGTESLFAALWCSRDPRLAGAPKEEVYDAVFNVSAPSVNSIAEITVVSFGYEEELRVLNWVQNGMPWMADD